MVGQFHSKTAGRRVNWTTATLDKLRDLLNLKMGKLWEPAIAPVSTGLREARARTHARRHGYEQ